MMKKLVDIIRAYRILQIKISWTLDVVKHKKPIDLFTELLFKEHEQNLIKIRQLDLTMQAHEKEIDVRNCLGSVPVSIINHVKLFMSEGYEPKSHTDNSVFFEKHTPQIVGVERLELHVNSADEIELRGESYTMLQARLGTLITQFKFYRTYEPLPGQEKKFLDMQFELDAEISSLYRVMTYLGYSPDIGDYIPSIF